MSQNGMKLSAEQGDMIRTIYNRYGIDPFTFRDVKGIVRDIGVINKLESNSPQILKKIIDQPRGRLNRYRISDYAAAKIQGVI